MRDNEIDDALRGQPVWEPPPGFARRVVRLSRTSQLDVAPVTLRDALRLLPSFVYALVMDAATTLAGFGWRSASTGCCSRAETRAARARRALDGASPRTGCFSSGVMNDQRL